MHTLDCSHVDTCLSCYLTDHCNGDSEMLIGVPVDGSTRHWQLRRELEFEVATYGDKLPEEITESMVAAAIADCFRGAHPLAAFDSSLESGDSEEDESCYAWFRFEWSEESES